MSPDAHRRPARGPGSPSGAVPPSAARSAAAPPAAPPAAPRPAATSRDAGAPRRIRRRLALRPDAAPAIAVERIEGGGRGDVGVLFCGGFHSSMHGIKALAIEACCARLGLGCTRFDYRGHGESGGEAADFTLLDWLDDALAVVDALDAAEPLVVVGSSMGAWLAVHLARRRPGRVRSLLLLAAAPDFLDERLLASLGDEARARLAAGEVVRLATPEDAAGYPLTRALIESGRHLALLAGDSPGTLHCPLAMLHGTADEVAPWERAFRLLERVGGAEATLELVKGAGHRLSGPAELARLSSLLERLCGAGGAPVSAP